MEKPAFIVTVDTEGDNLWSKPRSITTENAKALPGFQELCEQYGVRPTYLTNYEMAVDPVFIGMARDAVQRNAAEVGMHLHAWNSPPIVPLTEDDYRFQPYLIDYPANAMRDKIRYLTRLLEDTFQVKMVSHRAGRWAVNQMYLDFLMEEGYAVDSSLTPHLYWRRSLGKKWRMPVALDYRHVAETPHLLQHSNRSTGLRILEVPFTVPRPSAFKRCADSVKVRMPGIVDIALSKLAGKEYGLRIVDLKEESPLRILDYVMKNKLPAAVMMLHSSELLGGCSPYFRTQEDIRTQTRIMKRLFERARASFECLTLADLARRFDESCTNSKDAEASAK